MITREGWGAVPPEQDNDHFAMKLPVKYIVVSSTQSSDCYSLEECSKVLKKVQKKDKEYPNLFTDLRWNFLIGADGEIYEGRGWKRKPPTNPKYGQKTWDNSVEIGYIGFYKESAPPMIMLQPTWEIILEAFRQKYIKFRYVILMDVFEYPEFRNEMERINYERVGDEFRGNVVF